jgi:uncharacterized protein
MLFTIHALDKPDVTEKRQGAFDAHREHVANSDIQIVMSGPLVSDDEKDVIGSFFLVDAPSREAVMDFHLNDPLYKADIWDSVNIQLFLKRVG